MPAYIHSFFLQWRSLSHQYCKTLLIILYVFEKEQDLEAFESLLQWNQYTPLFKLFVIALLYNSISNCNTTSHPKKERILSLSGWNRTGKIKEDLEKFKIYLRKQKKNNQYDELYQSLWYFFLYFFLNLASFLWSSSKVYFYFCPCSISFFIKAWRSGR